MLYISTIEWVLRITFAGQSVAFIQRAKSNNHPVRSQTQQANQYPLETKQKPIILIHLMLFWYVLKHIQIHANPVNRACPDRGVR